MNFCFAFVFVVRMPNFQVRLFCLRVACFYLFTHRKPRLQTEQKIKERFLQYSYFGYKIVYGNFERISRKQNTVFTGLVCREYKSV